MIFKLSEMGLGKSVYDYDNTPNYLTRSCDEEEGGKGVIIISFSFNYF